MQQKKFIKIYLIKKTFKFKTKIIKNFYFLFSIIYLLYFNVIV